MLLPPLHAASHAPPLTPRRQILVVGMSIDYAVHLAHFYVHAQGSRYERTREAMFGVGVSVLGGAITTIGAGIPLFFCVVMFFFTQGLFIFFTALCALYFSLFFLLPLLMIAGPEGDQGNIVVWWRRCRRLCRRAVGGVDHANSGGGFEDDSTTRDSVQKV